MTTYFEVLRHDGTKQYTTQDDHARKKGAYLLYGSGFFISQFDAVSVTEISEVPSDKRIGYVYFDEPTPKFRALCDINRRWNGWAMPHISEKSIKRFCKIVSLEGFELKLVKKVPELLNRLKYMVKNGIILETKV